MAEHYRVVNPEGFTYEDETHTYRLKGRRISGITEALTSVGLRPNLEATVPGPVLEQAQRRGRHIHSLTQFVDEGRLGEVHPAYENYMRAYMDFKRDRLFVPLIVEQAMGSAAYFFGGRPDRGGLLMGKRAILEVKTGEGPLEDWIEFQLGLQDVLMEACAGFKAEVRAAVKLHADGTYDFRVYKDHRAKGLALGAVAISNWKLGRA